MPERFDHSRLEEWESSSFTSTNKIAEYDGFLLITVQVSGDEGTAVFINDVNVGYNTRSNQSPHRQTGCYPLKKGDKVRLGSPGALLMQKVAYYKHSLFIKAK